MTMTIHIWTHKYMMFVIIEYPKVGLETMERVFDVHWLLT